jgi:hypothetical protein
MRPSPLLFPRAGQVRSSTSLPLAFLHSAVIPPSTYTRPTTLSMVLGRECRARADTSSSSPAVPPLPPGKGSVQLALLARSSPACRPLLSVTSRPQGPGSPKAPGMNLRMDEKALQEAGNVELRRESSRGKWWENAT